MRVVFVMNKEPVLEAARHISARSADECFSAREVAHATGLEIEAVLNALGRLCEALWCTPVEMEPDSLNPDERWTLIRKSLTSGRVYEVLGIEADSYRILNDPETWPYGNDPVLFDPSCFRMVDSSEPSFWVCRKEEEGERYCYPLGWDAIGLFEDYHDGVEEVRQRFWEDVRRYYPETWQERKGCA